MDPARGSIATSRRGARVLARRHDAGPGCRGLARTLLPAIAADVAASRC